MPPEDNKNLNNLNLDPLKVAVDPVFKTNQNTAAPAKDQINPTEIPSAFNVLNNQKYTPAPTPVSTPQATANSTLQSINNPTNAGLEKKSIVRTYKGDLASAIEANHISSINIAIAENEKMHSQLEKGGVVTEPEETPSEYSKSRVLIFISVTLVIVGIIAVAAIYFVKNKNTGPIVIMQEVPTVITSEYKDELNLDTLPKGQFVNALASKLNDIQIPVNTFYNSYITIGTTTKRLITAQEFVTLADLKMPDQIKRTLLPDFMVGMFSFGKDLPFIIFKTSYFENTYAGLLTWEKDLEKDLQVLFRLDGASAGGGLTADLTPMTARRFEDGVIVNKDVRLIRDTNHEIMLLYSILDKETIIITVNETAFKEIVNRLNKEKGLKR